MRILLKLRCVALMVLIVFIAVHLLPGEPGRSDVEARSILLGYDGRVTRVAFAPDGRTLATLGLDGAIRLWDVASARELDAWGLSRERSHDFAFASDGRTLATAGDETIAFRNSAADSEGEPQGSWPLSAIRALRFSPDGHSLLTADRKGTIQLQGVAQGLVSSGFETSATGIVELGFAPDGICCAALGQDFRVRIWKQTVGFASPTLRKLPEENQFSLVFSTDGSRLFTGSRGGTVQAWETATGRAKRRLVVGGWITALAVSADARFLACGRDDGTVIVLDLESATQPIRHTLRAHALSVSTLAFSPEGRLLASGSNDSTVKLWDLSVPLAETISISSRSTLTPPIRRALCSR